MTTTKRLLAVLIVAGAFCSLAVAQQNVPERAHPTAAERERLEQLRQRLESLQSESVDRFEAGIAGEDAGPVAAADREYDAWVFAYTQGAYAWHQSSTIVIFWVVMLLVLSGVALATWQLSAWMKRFQAYDQVFLERLRKGERADAAAITGVGKAPDSTFDLKSDALGLSSPYVGVVILGLSMGFFLAYLLLVYPIVQGP